MKKKIVYILSVMALFYSCSKSTEKLQPESRPLTQKQALKLDSQKVAGQIKTLGAGSSEWTCNKKVDTQLSCDNLFV
jgi:hypothetical protein